MPQFKKLSYVDKKDIIHESISKDVRDYLNLSSESVSNNYTLNWFYYIKMEVHSRLYACIEFALSNSISNVDISEWFNDFGNDKMVFKDSETECHNLLFKTLIIVDLGTLSYTFCGISIHAKFIRTFTPASVRLDISKHPSPHQLTLRSAYSISP